MGVYVTIEEERARKNKKYILSTFVIFGLLSAFAQIRIGYKSSADLNAEKTARVKAESDYATALKEIGSNSARAAQISDATARFQESNATFQARLLEDARRTIINTTTGGESFGWVTIRTGQTPNTLPMLAHEGKYPLSNINIRIAELGIRGPYETFEEVEMLAPGSSMSLKLLVRPDSRRARGWNIFFFARNGYWVEKLRLRMVGLNWSQSIKVYRNDREIWRMVDKNFPDPDKDYVDGEGNKE